MIIKTEFRPKMIDGKYAHQVEGYRRGDFIKSSQTWPYINLIMRVAPGKSEGYTEIHSVRFIECKHGGKKYMPAGRIKPFEIPSRGYRPIAAKTWYKPTDGIWHNTNDGAWWIVEEVEVRSVSEASERAKEFLEHANPNTMYWSSPDEEEEE